MTLVYVVVVTTRAGLPNQGSVESHPRADREPPSDDRQPPSDDRHAPPSGDRAPPSDRRQGGCRFAPTLADWSRWCCWCASPCVGVSYTSRPADWACIFQNIATPVLHTDPRGCAPSGSILAACLVQRAAALALRVLRPGHHAAGSRSEEHGVRLQTDDPTFIADSYAVPILRRFTCLLCKLVRRRYRPALSHSTNEYTGRDLPERLAAGTRPLEARAHGRVSSLAGRNRIREK